MHDVLTYLLCMCAVLVRNHDPCAALHLRDSLSDRTTPPRCLQAVLSSYNYDSTMTLTFLQGLVTILCLTTMKRLRYIDYPNFEWSVARKVAPLSFVFIAYVVISLIRCVDIGLCNKTENIAPRP